MTKKKKKRVHQGFLLAITLTEDKLSHRLLRFIPLSSVKLEDVECMRSSFFDDMFPKRSKFHHICRNRYWWSTANGVDRRLAPMYVIETRNKRRRIFLRMPSEFHYRVRSAIGRHKSMINFD